MSMYGVLQVDVQVKGGEVYHFHPRNVAGDYAIHDGPLITDPILGEGNLEHGAGCSTASFTASGPRAFLLSATKEAPEPAIAVFEGDSWCSRVAKS